jgi:hypothetical protein
MRRTLRLSVAVSLALVVLIAAPRVAGAQEEEEESAAMRANRGLELGLGPVLVLPSRDTGPWGAGVRLEGRYGFRVGPTVLAPGARFGGYILSERVVGLVLPTFRVTLPVGPLAPYVMGGVGVGWLTNETQSGAALLGGGGLMIHVGRIVALGAEGTYQAITGTEFHSWTIGPSLSFFGT